MIFKALKISKYKKKKHDRLHGDKYQPHVSILKAGPRKIRDHRGLHCMGVIT